jgi:hypothetical protein
MRLPAAAWALLALLPAPPLACGGDSSTGRPADDGGATDVESPDAAAPDDSPDDAAPDTDVDSGPGNGCAPPRATPIVIAADVTASTSWTCDHVYLVRGTVRVMEPATLTIAAGTTVLMSNDVANDGNLIVAPGAQLVAVGTRDLPVVFTSSAVGAGAAPKPGDWGCVALVGRAPGNWGAADGGVFTSGSPDDANNFPGNTFPFTAGGGDASADGDGSGTLRYVRLEYGGNVRNASGAADHEMLGIYGVGKGTLLEYVDMRQATFGCLFAQGGSFRARHLVCQYGGESGGFDFTRGNRSRAQFLIAQENPNRSSEGVGFKGPGDVNQLPPLTSPVVYNVTACGTFGGIDKKDPYSFFMRRAPAGVLGNFIGVGYRAGLGMTGGSPVGDAGHLAATTRMQSSVLFGNFDPTFDGGTNIVDPAASMGDTDLVAWYGTPGWQNVTTDPGIAQCADANTLRAAPATSLTATAATPPSDDFFDATATYIGAFKDSADGWATGNWVVWSDH